MPRVKRGVTARAKHKKVLALAEKRFSALKKIEKRHAEAYQSKLDSVTFPVV